MAACEVAAPLVAARLPTLALWGSSDWLTSRAEHVTLARIVDEAHPGLGAFAEITGADHGFFAHATPEDSFRANWYGDLHPGVVDAVARFAT